MPTPTPSDHDDALTRAGWLYPLTYAAHVGEEYWGDFPAWWSRVVGVRMTAGDFLAWNGMALLLMVGSVLWLWRDRRLRWLPLSFGTAFLANTLTHLAASLLTASYSPGLVTGLLLWLPLGAWTLARGRAELSRRSFRAGLLVGLGLHACVTLVAFFAAR